ncbi:MAG: hypothetical protein MPI95_03160 [Nitrosopumilus sp.]|nr:hypothetical protein [Nitrosopumilus sp.]MDA7941791.1 hypothetical protein [Nitrosopumilus sp.]MDA7943946.1 hypothetical protein [Nitrosopumilus sp.]MDA7944723.1 hypothetical protein [Nitrosopumilus sp.]MDA7952885.1 hypothetical protein [Nitrosopumilus sp.]
MGISFGVEPSEIRRGEEVRGSIEVAYPGRYDGVVVDTQVSDSNGHVTYRSYNGRKIERNVARLHIPRDEMPDGRAEFTATFEFDPEGGRDVRFRASVIEQHKEVASGIVHARYA